MYKYSDRKIKKESDKMKIDVKKEIEKRFKKTQDEVKKEIENYDNEEFRNGFTWTLIAFILVRLIIKVLKK